MSGQIEYLGGGLYIKFPASAPGEADIIEERPAGRQTIRLDRNRINAIFDAMRARWPVHPVCPLCLRLQVQKKSAEG